RHCDVRKNRSRTPTSPMNEHFWTIALLAISWALLSLRHDRVHVGLPQANAVAIGSGGFWGAPTRRLGSIGVARRNDRYGTGPTDGGARALGHAVQLRHRERAACRRAVARAHLPGSRAARRAAVHRMRRHQPGTLPDTDGASLRTRLPG